MGISQISWTKYQKQLRMDQIAPKFHKCSDISQMWMEGIKCFSKTRVWNHKPLADFEILGNNSLFNEMRVFPENHVFVGGSRFVDLIWLWYQCVFHLWVFSGAAMFWNSFCFQQAMAVKFVFSPVKSWDHKTWWPTQCSAMLCLKV